MKKIIHYILILLMSIYVVFLYGQGDLTLYVSPRYVTFTYIFGLLAAFFSVVGIIRSLETRKLHYFQMNRAEAFGIGMVVLIIVLGFSFPPQSLSVGIAEQREGNFLATDINAGSAVDLFLGDSENLDLGDWISAIAYDPDPQSYVEKSVKVNGFAFISDNLPENTFRLSKFVLTCCVVDARPVGLLVSDRDLEQEIVSGEWYEVRGTFAVREDKLVIVPTEITLIEEPDEPYIF